MTAVQPHGTYGTWADTYLARFIYSGMASWLLLMKVEVTKAFMQNGHVRNRMHARGKVQQLLWMYHGALLLQPSQLSMRLWDLW